MATKQSMFSGSKTKRLTGALGCVLLFFGTGFAICYFNADTGMSDALVRLMESFGAAADRGIIALFYSIGIALGILGFFFPPFRGKEPTPLELKYQEFQDQSLEFRRKEKKS